MIQVLDEGSYYMRTRLSLFQFYGISVNFGLVLKFLKVKSFEESNAGTEFEDK